MMTRLQKGAPTDETVASPQLAGPLKGIDMTVMTARTKLLGGLCFAALLATAGIQAAAQDPKPTATGKDHPLERTQLLETRSCDRCDLSGEDFTGKDLKGASLAGANLTGAAFYKADLTNGNFGEADLTKALFQYANLTNVNFGNAKLDGANFTGAKGANLVGALTTENTTCPDGQSGPCR